MSKPSFLPVRATTVTVVIDIAAPASTCWKAMIEDIGKWWPADFLICRDSVGMTIEPKVGGALREFTRHEGAGFLWGHIIRFEPESHLAFTTQAVPPWGGPAQSVVQIELATPSDADTGMTKLTLMDSLVGHLTDDHVESTEQGWRMLLGEGGLKSFLE